MMPAKAETMLRQFYRFALAGDEAGLSALLTPDICWNVGGAGPLSGRHAGKAEVTALFRRLRRPEGGGVRPFGPESVDILVGDHHCALVDCIMLDSGEATIASHQVWVVSLRDGKVASGYQYIYDQASFDRCYERS